MTSGIEVGAVLRGKYRVERVLGVGGMGIVVAARQLQLDRLVAIKFLLPEMLEQPEVVERFQREARAASKLESVHAARVIDVDALEDGSPFLVMEYLEGTDLRKLLKQFGKLPIEAALDYVVQTCEGVAEAHAAGVVHRDGAGDVGNRMLIRRAAAVGYRHRRRRHCDGGGWCLQPGSSSRQWGLR